MVWVVVDRAEGRATALGWRQVGLVGQVVETLDLSALPGFRRWFAQFDAAAWDCQLSTAAMPTMAGWLTAEQQRPRPGLGQAPLQPARSTLPVTF